MSGSYFAASVFWEGHSHLDFDRRQIRKAMRKIGADIRKVARKKVARRAVSAAGQAPGKRSGALQRAIKYRVSKPGLLVSIRPDKTPEMGKDYYPAFLNYGTPTVAKRANYMEQALDERNANARQVLADALQNALIARK